MPRPISSAESAALESMIDSCGLSHLAEAIASICVGKADYIQANWQDNALAKQWEDAARAFAIMEVSPVIESLSR